MNFEVEVAQFFRIQRKLIIRKSLFELFTSSMLVCVSKGNKVRLVSILQFTLFLEKKYFDLVPRRLNVEVLGSDV